MVDVLAVRRAALPALGQPALRDPLGGAALRGCITGEGRPGAGDSPPAELLLAAVACAASGEVRNPNPNPNPHLNPNLTLTLTLTLTLSRCLACQCSG